MSALLTSLAFASLGLWLGTRLHVVLSAPVMVGGSFYLLAFPASWSTVPWVENMINFTDCCGIWSAPDPRILGGTALTALGLLSLTAGLFLTGESPRKAALSVALAGVLVGGSFVAVRDTGFHQSVPRGGPVECELIEEREYCIWPEAQTDWDAVRDVLPPAVEEAEEAEEALGFPLPDRWSMAAEAERAEGGPRQSARLIPFGVTEQDAPAAVVAGALPHVEEACFSDEGIRHDQLQDLYLLEAVTEAWWSRQVYESFHADDLFPEAAAALTALADKPTDEQRHWILRAGASMTTCDVDKAGNLL
ncbi:DUF7224 domain-containing protein [Nesterenkonia suensis]